MAALSGIGTSGLVRKRLLDELTAARPAAPAILVAPAGFGKTTLLAHYARAFDGPASWVSVSSSDAEPAALIARLRDGFPVPLPAAPDAGDPAEFLRSARAGLTADALLMIDDAHALEGSPAEAVLERLLVAGPPKLHVAIGTRRLPGFNLSRHELAGLVVIDAERLRFRTWEAEQLLRDVYGEPLPPADIAALTRRLGGWAAGLHLYHLSTRGSSMSERRAAVAALDGRAALSRAYLARTVLADLPAELRDFLVRTSVFDVLTAERCNRILGRTDSQSRLEELSRLQAFTASPDSGHSFRYHEVMRAHLGVTLADELGEEAARRCHAEAAQLLEAEGALAEAARAQARAEDWSAVRRLLRHIGAGIADGDGVPRWRDVLPAWLIAEDPWLVLAEGRHLFRRGQLAGSLRCFGRAQTLFSYEHGRSHCRQAATRTAVWLPGPACAQGHWANWLRAATQRHPALVAAQAERLDEPAARLVQIMAHLLAGQVGEARTLLAGADLDQAGVAGLAVRLLHAAAAVAADRPGAAVRLTAAAVEAEASELPWMNRMARASVALDGTEQGAKTALAVAEECALDGDSWGQAIATGLAWLAPAPDAADAAADALAALAIGCRQLDAGVLEAWARALQAVAATQAGHPDGYAHADQAAAAARLAGVPGAQVAAMIAAARAGSRRGDLLAAARRLATDCGLPARLIDAWARPGGDPAVVANGPTTVMCLGRFHAAFDGQPVDLSRVRPRVRVLMRLLAMYAGRPVHRDVLVSALWPDMPGDAANHKLHVAMWSLRKLLEPGSPRGHCRLLVRDGDAYQLNLPAGAYCDVAEVRAALAEARRARSRADDAALAAALRAVLVNYGGDLLPGDGSEEWVVPEREMLRWAAADAGAALAALEFARGDTDAAVAAAERSIAIDRYHDEAWRLLITGYERGDQAAARHARWRYRQVLTELSLDQARTPPTAAPTAGLLSAADRPPRARPRPPGS